MSIKTRTRIIVCAFAILAACSPTRLLTPYRIDVRQGNFITQEMVGRLQPGMSKEQVRFTLGTPLVADIFHADRWDYIYLFQPGRGEPEKRRVTVFFESGRLSRVEGDVAAAVGGTGQREAPQTQIIELPGGSGAQADQSTPIDRTGTPPRL